MVRVTVCHLNYPKTCSGWTTVDQDLVRLVVPAQLLFSQPHTKTRPCVREHMTTSPVTMALAVESTEKDKEEI